MNLKKSPLSNLYNYVFVLTVIAAANFIVSPVMANHVISKTPSIEVSDLKAFEGYYRFERDTNSFIQITIKENQLVLKQLWDEREITFRQTSELEFFNFEHDFPLKFLKDKSGKINQLITFADHVWKKVKDYKPVIKKEIQLTPSQMKSFEGTYQLTGNDEALLQMTVLGNSLIVKELWSENEFKIVPESDLIFFGKGAYYPVRFIKDDNGIIKEAVIFNKDVWVKVKK